MENLYNFGRVKQILEEACGLDATHVHEDLVFVEHSAFLLQFDPADLLGFWVHFNPECPREDRDGLMKSLKDAARRNGMHCKEAGEFLLEELPETRECRISFMPA